jgi:hypothetical protein
MRVLPLAWALTVSLGVLIACSDDSTSSSGGKGGSSGAGSPAQAGKGGTPGAGGDGTDPGSAGDAAGGSDGEGGGGGAAIEKPETSAEFCEAFAELLCGWAESCNGFQDCTTWGGYQGFVRECADSIKSEAGGYLIYDADEAGACLMLTTSETCAAATPGPLFNRPTVRAACADVFQGTRELEEECTSGDFFWPFDECADGYCLRETGPSGRECFGECAPYVEEDGDCSGGELCEPGLFCNDGSCGPGVGIGESCANATCEVGLVCGGDPGTCRKPGPAGAACEDRFDCLYPSACGPDQKCSEELDVDDPCVTDDSCKDGLYCRNDGENNTTCAVPLEPSASCTVYDRCVAGYACSDGAPSTCVKELGALDEACGPSGCEGDLWCELTGPGTGICRERVPLNGSCTETAGCEASVLRWRSLEVPPAGCRRRAVPRLRRCNVSARPILRA